MLLRTAHNRNLKTRLISAFLVAMAWLASWCVVMEPSHACCRQAAERLTSALPACCSGQLMVQPADQQPSHGFDPGPWIAQNVFDVRNFLDTTSVEGQQSTFAKAYVPDQSGRYLELRVLLN